VKVTICQTQPWLDFGKTFKPAANQLFFHETQWLFGVFEIPEAGDSLIWILFKYPEMANSLILLS